MLPNRIRSDMTIYNAVEDASGVHYTPTILKDVFWQAAYGANMARKGITTSDKVSVVVLISGDFSGKQYLSSVEYRRAADKTTYFTIAKGDKILNAATTEEIASAPALEKAYGLDAVFTVSDVIVNDFGARELRHFKIIGK